MKVAVLAGGRGSRLAELTEVLPKPMVQIGEHPILWHIMRHYSAHGHHEFALALGYKGHIIKRYFLDYKLLMTSLSVDLKTGETTIYDEEAGTGDWRVHLIETGLETGTGGRLFRMKRWLDDGTFLLTYGDGVSNVDIDAVIATHRAAGRLATVTAVRPPSRFGGLAFEGSIVTAFEEKPQIGEGWINGGFMVFEPGVFAYMDEKTDSLERDVLEHLAADRQLAVHCHDGFWQCMDTLRERTMLEELWQSGRAPWKTWA